MTVAIIAAAALALPGAASTPPPAELARNLRAELRRERTRNHRLRTNLNTARHQARGWRHRYRTVLATNPDAETSMRLAALAYGQDWRQLRACARSEGYRDAERHQRGNHRPNRGGSGAFGAWQFMPATFAGTPQGRAGLPIWRVDVQAHAAAWMWQQGRRREWAGAGC